MDLYPFQVDGVEFLLNNPRAILADEPGLGKTYQALVAARGATLIIAPAAFKNIWSDAIEECQQLLDPGVSFTIVSYHQVNGKSESGKLTDYLKPELNKPWSTVIIDESHHLKNRKTKWTVAIFKLKTDRLYLLTGTPIPNWSHELYCLLRLLFPGDKRFTSYWRWVGTWFEAKDNPWGGQTIGKLRDDKTWEDFAVDNGLTTHYLRRLRDDVLPDLPPLREQTIVVDMLPKQKAVYNRVKKSNRAILESGHEILAWSTGGMYTKLHKLSTGVEVEDPSSKPCSNKLSILRELMVDRVSDYTLVVCRFNSSVDAVCRLMDDLGISSVRVSGSVSDSDRELAVSSFQAGKVGVMVATIDTIAEGYTLTKADCVIFVERHPRPSKNEQTRRRIHRIGQVRPCLQIDIVTANSVDTKLVDLLSRKTDNQMAVLGAIDLL